VLYHIQKCLKTRKNKQSSL